MTDLREFALGIKLADQLIDQLDFAYREHCFVDIYSEESTRRRDAAAIDDMREFLRISRFKHYHERCHNALTRALSRKTMLERD